MQRIAPFAHFLNLNALFLDTVTLSLTINPVTINLQFRYKQGNLPIYLHHTY